MVIEYKTEINEEWSVISLATAIVNSLGRSPQDILELSEYLRIFATHNKKG